MRRSILVYLLIFIAAEAILFAINQKRSLGEMPARVYGVKGMVEIQSAGSSDWKAVQLGQLVHTGGKLRTGADAQVDLGWPNDQRLALGQNSSLDLLRMQTSFSNFQSVIETRLPQGAVWIKLRRPARGETTIKFATPTVELVAGPNAVGRIQVEPEGNVQVEVRSGQIQAQQGEINKAVGEQQTGIFSQNAQVSKIRPMSVAEAKDFEKNPALAGPSLAAIEPKEGMKVSTSLVKVSGFATPGNIVKIRTLHEGRPEEILASLDKTGAWSANVNLTKGENELIISAVNSQGEVALITRKVTY